MNGVRRFFEHDAPARLARDSESARGIDGRCLFDVGDPRGAGSRWIVDFSADPARVMPDDGAATDCQIVVAADDFEQMIDDPAAGQVLVWQGRMRLGGDQVLLRRVGDVLFASPDGVNSAYAGYYTALSRLVPDPRLTFMNHGYVEGDDDGSWLDEADRPWRFAINLIRRTLAGAEVGGARVLDVGCGRGGPAAHIATYLEPRAVTGLDACAEAIVFCRERHADPRLDFVHGSAERMPLQDARFDIVLNVESSHCYLDRRRFFAEVVRVLKPGGTFCYADIFQPDELDQARRLLSEFPELCVVDDADITRQVADAIERNRETLADELMRTVDLERRNGAIVGNLIHSINVEMYENYISGRWGYHVWRIDKAAA